MRKKSKQLPHFKSADEERDFWATHDGTDYFDFSKARVGNAEEIHGGVTAITIRFSEPQLNVIRRIAKRMDVGYQSLIKVWLDERLLQEKAQRGI